MALSTPLLTEASAHKPQADTIKQTRFFDVIDNRPSNVTIKDICEQEGINHSTGKNWLKKQKRLNDAAYRRGDKTHSGRYKKMSFELINQMLDLHRNPVRNQPWPV